MTGVRVLAMQRVLESAAAKTVRPRSRDAARSLRVLADQIDRNPNNVPFLVDAGAVCLLALEGAMEAEDRLRKNPQFTHAAMSAQAMEKSDG